MFTVKDIKHGVPVVANIAGYLVKDAKISINKNNDDVYICQNIIQGSVANDKLGYEFSWNFGTIRRLSESEERGALNASLGGFQVYSLKLLETEWDDEVNYD